MTATWCPGSPSPFLNELSTIFTIYYIFISKEQSRPSLSVNCCSVGFVTGDRLIKKPGLSKGTSVHPHLLPKTKGEETAMKLLSTVKEKESSRAWRALWVLQVVKGN